MKRTNISLDDQAQADAQKIAKEYGLGSVSAAVRFALREIAKRAANPNIAHEIAQTSGSGSTAERPLPD